MLCLKCEESGLYTLNEFRKQGILCDIILTVESRRYFCHRNVLATKSPYFQKIFITEYDNFIQTELQLDNINKTGFDIVLKLIYEESVVLREDNTRQISLVLSVCEILEIKDISNKCLDYLKQNLNISSALDICIDSSYHKCAKLNDFAKHYLMKHFYTASFDNKFLDLPFEILKDIVYCDSAFAPEEKNMFEAVSRWISYKPERDQYIDILAAGCRYGLIHKTYLEEFSALNNALAISMLNLKLINNNVDHVSYKTRTLMRIYVFAEFLCDEQDEHCYISVSSYNGEYFEKVNRMDMVTESKCFQRVTTCSRKMYKFSFHPNIRKNNFQTFDAIKNTWIDLTVPRSAVSIYNMVSFDNINTIYMNTASRIKKQGAGFNIFAYDTLVDQWHTVRPFSPDLRINSSCLVSHNNILYTCGGLTTENYATNHTFLFDPRLGRWIILAPMLKKRGYAAAVGFQDRIYLCGGINGHYDMYDNVYKTMMAFDVRMNRWISAKSMPVGRFSHNLIAYENQLWSMGGKYSTIDIFDFNVNNWKPGPTIDATICNNICVTVF